MRNHTLNRKEKKGFGCLKWLPVALVLVFTLMFFGYLRPEYDIVLYTDNIVGEGLCSTAFSAINGFAHYYQAGFYFGEELKRAQLKGYNFDASYIYLNISGVNEAEIEGFDLCVFGVKVAHYNQVGRIPEGQYDGINVSVSEDGQRVHFDFENPDEGTTIALVSHFAPWWFWALYFALVLLISVLIAMLFSIIAERMPVVRLPLYSAGAIMATILAGCFFCGSMPYVDYTDLLLNWLVLYCAALMLNALTLPYLGTLLTMAFTTFWYVANYFVIILRGKPIMPADLKAIGTAAEVMGGYTFVPSWKMIVGVIAVLLYSVGVVIIWKQSRSGEKPTMRRRIMSRAVSALLAVGLFVIGINTPEFKSLDKFTWDLALQKSFHQEGMVLTYLKCALNSTVKKPEGYSRETVQAYLSDYPEEEESEAVRPTRIIMVMNEAFSDLRTVGLDERVDVMPFVDSLDENTIEGSLYVSIFGGGTCNTEFEALTGNTLAFLGTGAYPYTENVTQPLFSLASYFRDRGYLTEAFHANEAQNWNRNMVYPNLGFSEFHDIYDYADALGEIPYLHKQPADVADYAYIEEVDAEHATEPRFLFNVTMQNHSGYERWEDVEKDPTVLEYGANLELDAQVYLSLVKASDDAVRQLVETCRDSDEPTMIVFFGDHQPGLPEYAQNGIYTKAENYLDWYKSRFFIWTNYETQTAHDVQISANFLPWLILERGNFPLPPYAQMLREVHEKYPVVSAMGVIDSDGNVYAGVSDVLDDPLIQKYQYVQYANLFDEIDSAWFEAK